MGKFERSKGLRIEREIVNLHKEIGVKAERVPLSGASRYQDNGSDLDIYAKRGSKAPYKAEVKGRASGAGFTLLERWLADYDLLFLRRDRQEPLVVVPWHIWAELIGDDHLTGTQQKLNGGHADETCEKPEVRRGDGDDHIEAARPR